MEEFFRFFVINSGNFREKSENFSEYDTNLQKIFRVVQFGLKSGGGGSNRCPRVKTFSRSNETGLSGRTRNFGEKQPIERIYFY